MRSFLFIFVVVTFSLFIAGCERAPAKSRVAGSYSGALNGATESLVLRADGTFQQQVSLPDGRSVTGNGTWTLKYKAVDLSGYMHFYEEGKKNGGLVRPVQVSITYLWGADMLIRDWGSGYYTLTHK